MQTEVGTLKGYQLGDPNPNKGQVGRAGIFWAGVDTPLCSGDCFTPNTAKTAKPPNTPLADY